MTHTVSGKITNSSDRVVSGVTVQAFDRRDIDNETLLGAAISKRGGTYEISWDVDSTAVVGPQDLNLVVRVFDKQGEVIGQSPVHRNPGNVITIDIQVEAKQAKKLSLLERFDQDLRPLLAGTETRNLDEDAVDFLAQMGEQDRQAIEHWRDADRIAESSELPIDVVYAALSQGLTPDDDGLFEPKALESAVKRSVQQRIVSKAAREHLEDALDRLKAIRQSIAAQRRAGFDTHDIVGRLLDRATGEPLIGYRVEGRVEADDETGGDLGYDVTNGQGLFGFTYAQPPSDSEDAPRVKLTLRIKNDGDEDLSVATLNVVADPEEVFEHKIALPAEEEPESPEIAGLDFELSQQVQSRLNEKGIHTLADLRRAGGLEAVPGLPDSAIDPQLQTLDAYARLSAVSSDARVLKDLVKKGISDPATFAKQPRARMMALTHKRMGDVRAFESHAASKARTAIKQNLLTRARLEHANGIAVASDHLKDILKRMPSPPCQCEDCEAAVSPLAYLADLLDYAITHIDNKGKSITWTYLLANFHQKFADLPADCAEMDKKVRQVRIAVEVLRRYLKAKALPSATFDKQSLAWAEHHYVLNAYHGLLIGLGTSYDEVRAAQAAPSEEQIALAARLGIDFADDDHSVTVNRLQQLFVDATAEPSPLSEAILETLFGLVDTTKDPLADDTEEPKILQWRLERLRQLWQEQDWDPSVDGDEPEPVPLSQTARPTIDPDLIGPGDLVSSTSGEAYKLWKTRDTWVNDEIAKLRPARVDEATPLARFDAIVEATLGQTSETTLAELLALEANKEAGDDIESDLDHRGLSRKAFKYLLRLRATLEADDGADPAGSLLHSEWEDLYAILVQIKKLHVFPKWRKEEQEKGLYLSTEFFQPPSPPELTVPPPEPPDLPAWRATSNDRRDWLDRLQGRVEQAQAVRDGLSDLVSTVEEETLPPLRDALIRATQTTALTRQPPQARAKWLTDHLLIDMENSGCQMTTRVAQAIETIQGLIWAVRNRLINDIYPDLELDDDDFDEAWKWIGSYATWRTAMFVFLYPENILVPNLRRKQTPAFRALVKTLRSDRRFNPERARQTVKVYGDYFRDVASLRPEATCQTRTRVFEDGVAAGYSYKLFVFARGGHTNRVYWSTYDPSDSTGFAQTFWQELPGLGDVINILGAVAHQQADDIRYLNLFARAREKGKQKLVFLRYDLETGVWESEATELELPEEASAFQAVLNHAYKETAPPMLAIRMPRGVIYQRWLSLDGSDWHDRVDWMLWAGPARKDAISELCALIEFQENQFCLLVRGSHGVLHYRLFGDQFDDGEWRAIDPASAKFRGAFRATNGKSIHVFYSIGSKRYYRTINPSAAFLDEDSKFSSVDSFNNWLIRVAGADLSTMSATGDYAHLSLYEIFANDNWSLFSGLPGSPERNRVRKNFARWLLKKARSADYTDPNFGHWKLANWSTLRFGSKIYKDLDLREALKIISVDEESIRIRKRGDFQEVLLDPPASARKGLGIVLPTAGWVEGNHEKRWFCYWLEDRNELLRCRFKSALGFAIEKSTAQFAPLVRSPFEPDETLTEGQLQVRRDKIADNFASNFHNSAANRTYLEEAYYFLPVMVALQLQTRGNFTAALDWFRTVYDYSMPAKKRKIYFGLTLEEDENASFRRLSDWLSDPLNPHEIAASRREIYTRFTLLAIIRCLLDYADAEFTRDTAESVPRARQLYLTALDLLKGPVLKQGNRHCADIIGSITIDPGNSRWASVLGRMKKDLKGMKSQSALEKVAEKVQAQLDGDGTIEQRLSQARTLVEKALKAQPLPEALSTVVEQNEATTVQALARLEADPGITTAASHAARRVTDDFRQALSLVSGAEPEALAATKVAMPALRGRMAIGDPESEQNAGTLLAKTVARRDDFKRLAKRNPLAPTRTAALAALAKRDPLRAINLTRRIRGRFVFKPPSFAFCIPPNPVLKALRLRAELNLYKIRTCRNIAGMERTLETYAAPTDTVSGLPVIGAGGQLVLPGLGNLKPTPYRFPVLVERAKQLVALAQQVEGALLSAIEKGDAERYNMLKARQDVQLARGGIRVQKLRVKEARDGVKLAELQKERAQIQSTTYESWLDEGALEWEKAAIIATYSAATSHGIAAAAAWGVDAAEQIPAHLAAAASSLASAFSMHASIELRLMQWELQKSLADQDVQIGGQQVRLAEDRVRVVEQERVIAEMQAEHAREVVDFLANKFTNVELYDWMSGVLEGVYGYFLQMATATAQLAGSQLAFERQEAPPPFVQDDYWESPSDSFAGAGDAKAPDRRGLTGSARLLQDIHQLDQHAFDTNQRKLQLTKTISLAQMAPAEFQRFRETGVLTFATPMELFDRDFPGHYLRLIRRLRTSVIALIPPTHGIRATLSTTGTSRVVIGGGPVPNRRRQSWAAVCCLKRAAECHGALRTRSAAGDAPALRRARR